MWQQLAILLLGAALSTAMLDLTHVCQDLPYGEVVSNPLDCQSYFVCSVVPTLRYCDSGLHFDSARKVCNWPAYANCQANAGDDGDVDATAIAPAAPPAGSTWRPSFVAIDTSSGQPTDPMTHYDPARIACVHFGAYFLPHAHNCREYYICAYGHLHQHQCGHGTRWNYKRQQCEPSGEAECYRKSPVEAALDAMEMAHAASAATQPDWTPTTASYPTTVCYTQTPDGSWHTKEDAGTGSPHTIDGTWYPTGSYHTATTEEPTTEWHTTSGTSTLTTPVVPANTARTDTDGDSEGEAAARTCPADRQAYLPHPKDCSKYYICIVGRPVLTTCPTGLYWDQKAEFCELAKNVQCSWN